MVQRPGRNDRNEAPAGRRLGVILAICSLATTACETPPKPEEVGPPPPDAATVRHAVEIHNRRLQQLQTLALGGVLEFEWIDDSGDRHAEPQIDADLWIQLPRRTALAGKKLGDIYVWLGSDDDRFWMFDATGSPSRLVVGRHDDPIDGRSPIAVRPLALLDLLGLVMLPLTAPAAPGPHDLSDPPRPEAGLEGAIVVRARGAGGPVRVYLDPETSWPVRVESLADNGEVLLTSTLSRYRRVQIDGVLSVAWPHMAQVIDITDPDGTMATKLSFEEMSDDVMEQLFDLDRVADHLRPDDVEGMDSR